MTVDFGMYNIYWWWRKKMSSKEKNRIFSFNTSCQSYNDITRGVFGGVWDSFIDKVMVEVMEKGHRFTMPERMGMMYIGKYKPNLLKKDGTLNKKSLRTDMYETKQLWKKHPELYRKKYVYYTNEHTFGYVMKMHWNKYICNVRNKRIYQFYPTKARKTELAKAIKDPNISTDYVDISHNSYNHNYN